MENCKYKEIFKDVGVEYNDYEKNNWKPLLRQCLITSGICCVYFMQGLTLGTPTVLVAQKRRDVNSTEIITDEMLSWLTATPVISSLPFVVILPLLFNRLGRKRTYLIIWLIQIIGFIIIYNSTSLNQILIGEIFAGPAFASVMTITPVIVAEYTSPKYRGILLNLKGATAFWGIWISNAIGVYLHWKNIAIVSFVCSIHFISILAWPESPYWLAKKGRYAESAKSHRWLKGVNENSEKELAQLIISQKKFNNGVLSSKRDVTSLCAGLRVSKIWLIIKTHSFYKPVLISLVLIVQFNLTGKFVISMYAIEVLRHLSPDQSFINKEMLILDGITVFSMYIGCVISRYFKRRTLLILFSSTGILTLYALSLYLYLASLSIIIVNDIVVLILLTLFSIAIGCGPLILCTSIYGELTPPHYQIPAMILVGSGGVATMSLLLKLSPYMFKNFKMHGSFLFYAISSSIALFILCFYLPETKNKTIREIELYFTKNKVLKDQDVTIADRDIELHSFIL